MTPRQRKFCDEYLISGNATDAAIKAGYSPKTAKQTGSENLAKPDLKAYIETELEKLHSAKIADAEEVMKYLTSVMRGKHTEEILHTFHKNRILHYCSSDNKRLGFFSEKEIRAFP